jgi:hypothetical protein
VKKSTEPALEGTVFFSRLASGNTGRRVKPLGPDGDEGGEDGHTTLVETLPDGTRRLWRIHANTFTHNPLW